MKIDLSFRNVLDLQNLLRTLTDVCSSGWQDVKQVELPQTADTSSKTCSTSSTGNTSSTSNACTGSASNTCTGNTCTSTGSAKHLQPATPAPVQVAPVTPANQYR